MSADEDLTARWGDWLENVSDPTAPDYGVIVDAEMDENGMVLVLFDNGELRPYNTEEAARITPEEVRLDDPDAYERLQQALQDYNPQEES